MLGCGNNRAFLEPRGGGKAVAELSTSALSYGYVLSDMSSGSATYPACTCDVLPSAFEHELVVYRDGDLAWAGPVSEPDFTEDAETVPARDLFAWFERRSLPVDRTFHMTDLGTIFRQYAEDALSRDPSPNITLGVQLAGILGDRAVLASAKRRAADELRELARSGVAFTMIGRTLRAGRQLGGQLLLTTDDVDNASVKVRGLSLATEYTVQGAPGIAGTTGGVSMRYGLLETVDSEPSILDNGSALAAAEFRLRGVRSALPVITASLMESAAFTFAELIPGSRVDTRLKVGCREIEGEFILQKVTVDAGDEEKITVDLIPRAAA